MSRSVLKGHDFSRAVTAAKIMAASAAEGHFSQTPHNLLLFCAATSALETDAETRVPPDLPAEQFEPMREELNAAIDRARSNALRHLGKAAQ